MNFGRGVESGIVQRTFKIALVVMFGGLIVNPFVSLKEDMSGVAPVGKPAIRRAIVETLGIRPTKSEHDVIDRSPEIRRLLPSGLHIIRNQRVSLDDLSPPRLDVRSHPFIVIENVRLP